jgi:hypothetical protein
MRYILPIILALFMGSAIAGDSGLYKDETRFGEGITLTRNGDTIQIFFFTYEPNDGCWNLYTIPDVADWGEDTRCHEQRWFLSAGNKLIGDTVTGFIYSTVGINYPEGIPDPLDPFVSLVGQDFVVGLYVLRRQGEGWRFVVFPVGDNLDPSDPLYNVTYDFSKVIMLADDPDPEVNPQ